MLPHGVRLAILVGFRAAHGEQGENAIKQSAVSPTCARVPPRRSRPSSIADVESTGLTVETIPGLGKTFVATREIEAGELLVRERPLIMANNLSFTARSL